MERPRTIPCPTSSEECKYFNTPVGCHESIHHVYPRRNAESRLQRDFGNLAINKIISCRLIHDLLDTLPAPQYPDSDKMKKAISES